MVDSMCIVCNKPLVGKQSKFCSIKCKNLGSVSKRRKALKQLAIAYKGGKCLNCGYNKCAAALTFHHPNGDKEFGIAASGYTRAWEKIRIEIDKCVLLCSNCHAEEHWRVVQR